MTLPDRPANFKQLVREGDRAAIAQLINQAVAHKHITATVAIADDCLEIHLTAAIVPDETIATTLIRRELAIVKPTTIKTVSISGKQTDVEAIAWVQEFQINAGMPSIARSPHQLHPTTRRSRRKQPFTLTFGDVKRLVAKFDPLKAGFISLLAVYGIFGAANYTVDGFLEGSDRVMMFLHGVNLIFHEGGHTIFAIFGQFLHILGGSLMQVLVPAGIVGYFVVTRQMYAGTIALCWTAQNLWDVSIYIKDAQERSLPLLGGEVVLHDWHFLLLDLHLLAQDQIVGNLTFFLGSLLYFIAIVGGIYYARIAP